MLLSYQHPIDGPFPASIIVFNLLNDFIVTLGAAIVLEKLRVKVIEDDLMCGILLGSEIKENLCKNIEEMQICK